MSRRLRFRPGWVPTLGTLLAVAILCALGTWQVQRLHWKRGLIAEWNARIDLPPLAQETLLAGEEDLAYRRGRVRGRWDQPRSIYVTHVARESREGARVLTPLRLAVPGSDGAAAVLVDRGWLPYGSVEAFAAGESEPGEVELTGLVFPLALGESRPGTRDEPRREWVRFDPKRHAAVLQEQLPYRIAPFLVQREADGGQGPLRPGFDRPRSRVDHRSYAITWYSMAAAAVAVWIGFGLQRGRQETTAT